MASYQDEIEQAFDDWANSIGPGRRMRDRIFMEQALRDEGYTIEFHRLGAMHGKLENPNRVPSKKMGRKGTRRAWKRAHPPGWSRCIWNYFDIPVRLIDTISEPGVTIIHY